MGKALHATTVFTDRSGTQRVRRMQKLLHRAMVRIRQVHIYKTTALTLAAMLLIAAVAPVTVRALRQGGTPGTVLTGAETIRADAIVPIDPATRKTITFRIAANTQDTTETCYYSDEYFKTDATTYYPSLCTATLCLAMSAFASTDAVYAGKYDEQAKNVIAFLGDADKLAMQDVTVNDAFRTQPTRDSIGVAIAHKTVTDAAGTAMPLIAVAVRGYNYESEWASNFDIGENGNHKGFQSASDQVIAFIKNYVTNVVPALQGQNVKLWITGFSRAAATANLTGAQADDAIADAGSTMGLLGAEVAKEDLYVYTFETPAGSTNADRVSVTRYGNIFNIITPHDLVPMVAPDVLDGVTGPGFGQYGVNKYLPSNETNADYAAQKAAMLRIYNAKRNDTVGYAPEYLLEKFVPIKLIWNGQAFSVEKQMQGVTSRGLYLYEFVRTLSDVQLRSRSHFIQSNLQGSIQETVLFFMRDLAKESSFKKTMLIVTFCLGVVSRIQEVWNALSELNYTALATIFKSILVDSIRAVGIGSKDLSKAIDGITAFVISIIRTNPDYFFSLFQNRDGLMQGHLPELCLSWLETMDGNYTASPLNAADVLQSGEYRIVTVTGNVKMKYEMLDPATGQYREVASQSPGNVTIASLAGGEDALEVGVNTDKEMIALLPVNAAYRITVTADGDETFHYAVSECNPTIIRREKRYVFYYQTPITAAETFTGIVPAFTAAETSRGIPAGSTYAYTLTGSAIGARTPTADLNLAALKSNYAEIVLREEDPDLGAAYGAGVQLVGSQAAVTAIPSSKGRFVGWRDAAGHLVSTDSEYLFRVERPGTIALTALFAPKPPVPVADGGGDAVPRAGDDTPLAALCVLTGLSLLAVGWRARGRGKRRTEGR